MWDIDTVDAVFYLLCVWNYIVKKERYEDRVVDKRREKVTI